MATAVFFHAHPDDESISTGGTMAAMADAGHRVVLVTATRGELGEVPEGLLGPGETLSERRARELAAACAELGVARQEYLGYRDSGMAGEPTNDDAACFWQADVDEAAGRLAAILEQEQADVLVAYDEHGGYGHPDHIQVHRVGGRAAELAGTPSVFEATMNRDAIARMMTQAMASLSEEERAGMPDPAEFDPNAPADDGNPFGTPEAEITHEVDVRAWVARKRRSIACHRSQVTDASFFLAMPDEAFADAFGTEWYIRRGAPLAGPQPGWLFE